MTTQPDGCQAEEIVGRLLDLHRRMHEHFELTTAAMGLSPTEGHVLLHLEVPAPMRAMADSLCCDASYVTILADRLEALGLVNRAPDPADRRVKRLVLTDKGVSARDELRSQLHTTSPALVGLDTDDRATLVRLLRVLTPATAAAEPA